MKKFEFSKVAIEALALPEQGRAYYYDTKKQGLELQVTPHGVKVFYLRRSYKGTKGRWRIGRWPTWTLAAARLEVDNINGELGAGTDRRAAIRKTREEPTLGEAFKQYREKHLIPFRRRPELADDVFERAFGHWRNRRLSTITAKNVQQLHRRLARQARLRARRRAQERATVAAGDDAARQRSAARRASSEIPATFGQAWANRAMRLLRAIYTKARRWGYEGVNPASGMEMFKESERERFLQPEELPRFFAAIEAETSADGRDFVMLSLLTGARKSNMLAARWAHMRIDVPDPTWTIPSASTKSQKPIVLPLAPKAVEILLARRKKAKAARRITEFVFASSRSKSGHLVEPRFAWDRILARAGLADLRLHDLRRSLGSWQAIQGASLPIVGKSLGHTSLAATAIYARLSVGPVRDSVNAAVAAMMVAGQQGKEPKVVPLSKARRR